MSVIKESGLLKIWGHIYIMILFKSTPTDFGDPYRRPRKWLIWLMASKLQPVVDVDASVFHTIFGRRVAVDSSIYLVASQAMQLSFLRREAASRYVYDHDLSAETVLRVGLRTRLGKYRMTYKEELLADGAAVSVCNIMWNVHYAGKPGLICPPLLRHAVMYDLVQDRLVLPEELFVIHGWPAPAIVNMYESCRGEAGYFPFVDIMDAESPHLLPLRCIKSLMGNGQHLKSLAAVTMFGLGCADLV